MEVTFGWNALNSQAASVLCYSMRFALTLPGGCCSFQGSQTLQGLDFTCIPLFSVSSFYPLCFWNSSPSLGSSLYLPTCFSSCPVIRCETERSLCPVSDPPLMFFEGSAPLGACMLIPVWPQPWGSMVGQCCPCQSRWHREIKAASTSCDSAHCMSKEPFSPSLPHDPISLYKWR